MQDRQMIPHFEAILKWSEDGLKKSSIPQTYHQYMKLKEAIDSIVESILCVTVGEDLPELEQHQGSVLQLVVDNTSLDKLRPHPNMIQVPLPMI